MNNVGELNRLAIEKHISLLKRNIELLKKNGNLNDARILMKELRKYKRRLARINLTRER